MECAIYNNCCYRIVVKGNIVRLISKIPKKGFKNYVNRWGKIFNDLFIKEVSENEIDFAYRVKHLVDYKGQTFEILSGIDKLLLKDDEVILFTDNPDIAREYGFEPYDNVSFQKSIHLNEVDRITEIKIPILRFKGMAPTKTIIEKHQIMDYINNLVE